MREMFSFPIAPEKLGINKGTKYVYSENIRFAKKEIGTVLGKGKASHTHGL